MQRHTLQMKWQPLRKVSAWALPLNCFSQRAMYAQKSYNPRTMTIVNACVGGLLTVMLAAVAVRFVQGYLAARASGKTWCAAFSHM